MKRSEADGEMKFEKESEESSSIIHILHSRSLRNKSEWTKVLIAYVMDLKGFSKDLLKTSSKTNISFFKYVEFVGEGSW